jgi:hypothetical protein
MMCAAWGVERCAHADEDLARFEQGRRRPLEPARQALAAQPLHHHVVPAVGQRAEREHVDDVRVADVVDRARLEDEPLDRLGVRAQLAAQHLDRGALADHRVHGAVHLTHPTLADQSLDPVLADDGPDLEHCVAPSNSRAARLRERERGSRRGRGRIDRSCRPADPRRCEAPRSSVRVSA